MSYKCTPVHGSVHSAHRAVCSSRKQRWPHSGGSVALHFAGVKHDWRLFRSHPVPDGSRTTEKRPADSERAVMSISTSGWHWKEDKKAERGSAFVYSSEDLIRGGGRLSANTSSAACRQEFLGKSDLLNSKHLSSQVLGFKWIHFGAAKKKKKKVKSFCQDFSLCLLRQIKSTHLANVNWLLSVILSPLEQTTAVLTSGNIQSQK